MEINFLGNKLSYNESWAGFLTKADVKEKLKEIEGKLKNRETLIPSTNDIIFKFLMFDLNNLRVVILGQDPYVNKNAVTGRAFEVGDHKNWEEKVKNRSSYYYLLKHLTNKKKIREIDFDKDIKFNKPEEMFDSWENQGVLLLNVGLTVTQKSGDHLSIWKPFMNLVIEYLISLNPTWFLWGNKAKSAVPERFNGREIKRYDACHPAARGGKFLYDKINHFKLFNKDNQDHRINWWGHKL